MTLPNLVQKLHLVLSSDNFRTYNVPIAKRLGNIEYAVALRDLFDQWIYLERTGQLILHEKHGNGRGMMYYTEFQAYDRTGIHKKSFLSAIKLFQKLKFIEVFKFGKDNKKHYILNLESIATWVFEEEKLGCAKRNNLKKPQVRLFPKAQRVVPKGTTYDKDNDKGYLSSKNGNRTITSLPAKKLSSSHAQELTVSSFDPFAYQLKNGEKLSLRASRAYNKYTGGQRVRLVANILWYEKQVDAGAKISTTHEKFLQWAINNDMAAKELSSYQNDMYARFMKEEHKLHKEIEILKTVVKLQKDPSQPAESISKNLPAETFGNIIDKFIESLK